MKKYLVILLALALFAGDVTAKGFGGSSHSSFGGGSSKPSGGSSWFSSSKPSTPAPAPAPTPAFQTNKAAPSTFSKPSATPTAAPATTPVKSNAIDAKLTQQSATAGKTFTSKADAESAYKQKLASQTTYTTATPPSSRPDYVPSNVSVGGHSTTVIYHSYPSGGYGYGYYDPMSHAFIALAATQMIINSNRQAELDRMYANQLAEQNMIAQQNQIAQQNAYAAQQNSYPVPVQPAPTSSGHGFFFYFFIGIFIIALIILLIKFA